MLSAKLTVTHQKVLPDSKKKTSGHAADNAAWPDAVYGVGELSCCLHDDSLALIVHLYALSRGVNGLAVGGVHHDDGELALL